MSLTLYPAIDIRGGHAVRLMQGDYERETAYDADPLEAATRWVEDGAEWLHIVDLDGARSGISSNLEHVHRIATALRKPIQFGGGLRSAEAVAAAFEAGVERVVIGTAALRDPQFLDAMLAEYDERIVVGVDARGGKAAIEGWVETSDEPAAGLIGALADRGARRFVFTPIEVDGTMQGPPMEQLTAVCDGLEAEVVYSGGIGTLDHLRTLASDAPEQVSGAIVGRALYEKRFGVGEAIEALTA
jgi:phosphoribosylformimino-5-aminoimidazole carboxamide ribotide isomerase